MMFGLGDLVIMKKPHACGANLWEVVRLGADIKIKCMNCGHIVMMPRKDFQKKLKKVEATADNVVASDYEHYVSFK